MLTQEQIQEYLANMGLHCPFCGSTNVDDISPLVFGNDANQVTQIVECYTCKKQWQDTYVLTSVKEIH